MQFVSRRGNVDLNFSCQNSIMTLKQTTCAWVKLHDAILSKDIKSFRWLWLKILKNNCIPTYSNYNLEFKWKELKFTIYCLEYSTMFGVYHPYPKTTFYFYMFTKKLDARITLRFLIWVYGLHLLTFPNTHCIERIGSRISS